MKLPFRPLALSLVLLSTTFCAKESQSPAPTAGAGRADAARIYSPGTLSDGTPIGFDPHTCDVDATGVEDQLTREAREIAANGYGAQINDDNFNYLRSALATDPTLAVDASGHVSGKVQYGERINHFTDAVSRQLTEYQNYVTWAANNGADVENPDDIKAIIQEQFDRNLPVQPGEELTEEDKTNITAIATGTKAQLGHAFDLFDALYKCDKLAERAHLLVVPGAGTKVDGPVRAAARPVSFKEFLELRKQGKISSAAFGTFNLGQRGFWSSLVKAVHKVVTVIVFTATGAAVGFALGAGGFGPVGGTVGAFVGGAFGFTTGIIGIRNNQCLFGPC